MSSSLSLVTAEQLTRESTGRALVHQALDYWAERSPDAVAIVNATRGTSLTWRQLRDASLAVEQNLRRLGFRKGDFLAASLPFLSEHVILEYACFRAGIIHAPLDLRLGPAEVLREVAAIGARGYAHLGKTPLADFRDLAKAVKAQCPSVEHLLQFSPAEECIGGAIPIAKLFEPPTLLLPPVEISPDDGVQVIFTSGSTGSPKPALLSHRGIVCQNLCLGTAFDFGPGQRVLLNLPASHVGGQAEILMTTLFSGGTAVMLEIFDAALSLASIQKHRVTLLGQIPAMFQMEWRQSAYDATDFSSLRAAVYGGQAVPRPFLEKMRTMAPLIATGLGLTETSGFVTYTPMTGQVDDLDGTLGFAMPAYPMSVRGPMLADGRAGDELPAGETGEVCFRGPQTFLGYVNNPEATAQVLSSDGWLYTGDMGSVSARGLRLSGRAKFVIKTAGYQVFPGDVESHFSHLTGQVASVGVVGHEHALWGEAMVAFVEKRPGAILTEADLRRHARSLAGYMRPMHYVVLEAGEMPLNRSVKVDVLKLQEMARVEVARLRERGRWDGANASAE
jgi:acyl-CoA synthetase (AMP-forming)/AMP-acid ligase II